MNQVCVAGGLKRCFHFTSLHSTVIVLADSHHRYWYIMFDNRLISKVDGLSGAFPCTAGSASRRSDGQPRGAVRRLGRMHYSGVQLA